MSRNVISNILGGHILLIKGGILKHWKFIVYLFILGILYISFSFMTRNAKQRISANDEVLRNLRSEYMGKYTTILNLGKRGEIEKLIEKKGLELIPPETPPARVHLRED